MTTIREAIGTKLPALNRSPIKKRYC